MSHSKNKNKKRRTNCCPGFGQNRVNFHQEPAGNTAGRTDPTWPNRAGYSIPCAIMLGSGWGGPALRELSRDLEEHGGSGSLCSAGSFCVFPLSVSLLFLFPLFAALLNCPYPNPPVSAAFFPFSFAPRWGEGRPRGAFVAGRSQTITLNLAPKRGAGITAGLSSVC